MHETTRSGRTGRALELCVLSLALLGSTGCGAEEAAPGSSEAGDARPTHGLASAVPKTPPLEDFDIPLDSLSVALGEGARSEARLLVRGAGVARIRIDGPLDLRFATHLRIEMRAVVGKELRIALQHEDESGARPWAAPLDAVWPDEAWIPVGIVVPSGAHAVVSALEMLLEGPATDPGIELRRITVVTGPPPGWAAALRSDSSQLIELSGESRHGRVLAPGMTLDLELGAGSVLSFSIGFWAPQSGVEGARVILGARAAGSALELGSYSAPAADSPPRELEPAEVLWRAVRLTADAVPDLPGAHSFHFTFEAPGECLAAITELRRYEPVRQPSTVLLISSDTHRGDHLGTAGERVKTPVLDALAARGTRFSDCFSTTNITVPSHVALMTGLHPRDSGITDNQSQLAEEAITLAERFRAAGYATYASTSINLLDPEYSRLGQGFDRFSAPEQRSKALDSIERLQSWLPDARDQPLFLWLHLFDAHAPYGPPERMTRLYWPPPAEPSTSPSLEASDPAGAGEGRDGILGMRSSGGDEDEEGEGRYPDWLMGNRDLEYARALYRGTVSYLDFSLSHLLSYRRLKRGIVAFTADHGECLGDHDIWWAHKGIYPDTLHVPLILAGPGVEEGAVVDAPVRQMDVGRTLLDLAGLEQTSFPGLNLLRTWDTAEERPRFGLEGKLHSVSVTFEGWHLIRHLVAHRTGRNGELSGEGDVELYHLDVDPGADQDLAAQQPARVAQFEALIDAWLADRHDAALLESRHIDEESLRRLAELGYADGEE